MARSADDLSTAGGRRVVRASSGFFRDLSRQLAQQGPPHGRPPGSDFRIFELVRVVERFATAFDDLPELIPGRHDYRVVRGTGTITPRFVVVGQLAGDGSVALVEFSADDEYP